MIHQSLTNTDRYKCSACIRKQLVCEEIVRQQFENKTLLKPCEGLPRDQSHLIPIHQDVRTI